MSQRLVALNDDLRRLRDDGFSVEIIGGYLVIRGVPYVGADRAVRWGDLVSSLHMAGDRTLPPETHVALFRGDQPCHKDGRPIEQILHQEARQVLGPDLEVDRSFSSKPAHGYRDYYEKMSIYSDLISGPAFSIDPANTARRFLGFQAHPDCGVFNFIDTATSRAGIAEMSLKLANDVIAIVGVGGTGSYILDLVAKSSVRQIKLIDPDVFSSHNAFRTPGSPTLEELGDGPSKVNYLANIYSRMHRNIQCHEVALTDETAPILDDVTFAFVAVDGGPTRERILRHLRARSIPFVDTGMGITKVDDKLAGQLRTTASSNGEGDHIWGGDAVPFGDLGEIEQLYAQNIQVAELNALAAALAVLRWKKFRGYYLDLENELGSVYVIDGNTLINLYQNEGE